MRISPFAAVLVLLVPAAGQPAAKTPTCADCHKQIAHAQPVSLMGRALLVPGANPVLAAHPKLTYQRAPYSYLVETIGDRSTYSVTDGTNRMSVPIQWGFGARSQTFVVEHQGRFYESLVSYYPKTDGLAITIGDERIQPKTLLEAFGRELQDSETMSCFECHSQGSVANERLQPESLIPGVHCENCHPDAKAHLQSISHGQAKPLPRQLGRLSPEEISNLCGQCHRTWDRVVRDRLRGEINVRFQPYRLANSKCYDGSDRRMSCIACHDPHRDAVQGAANYDPKCLACHDSRHGGKACPVGTSACSGCHMPKVPLPGGLQVFTDHQIRIARAGDPYPN